MHSLVEINKTMGHWTNCFSRAIFKNFLSFKFRSTHILASKNMLHVRKKHIKKGMLLILSPILTY